jgi:hypothetical protein
MFRNVSHPVICPTGKSMCEPNDFLSRPVGKNISFRGLVETDLLIRHPVPIRGAFRDRHGRGMGCGGRGSRF